MADSGEPILGSARSARALAALADPIDVHVGAAIRTRRKALGLSQENLADYLGLTFQQIQKYERGANRVSASTLFRVAEHLQVPFGFFVQGLDPSGPKADQAPAANAVAQLLLTAGGRDLANAFARLSPALQRGVVIIVEALAAAKAGA